MIRIGAIIAWLATAILFSFAAWQVVQATDEQTTEAPSAPVVYAAGLTSIDTSEPVDESTSIPEPLVPPTNRVSDSSTPTGPTSTSLPLSSEGGSDGSSPPVTPANPERDTRVIPTEAGTVSVSYEPGEVRFEGASPAIGWTIEVEERGPDAVEVKFERDDRDVEVTVEWEDGELVVQIDEESDD